jgi:hypothetical protein
VPGHAPRGPLLGPGNQSWQRDLGPFFRSQLGNRAHFVLPFRSLSFNEGAELTNVYNRGSELLTSDVDG